MSSSDALVRVDGLSAAWSGTPVLRSLSLEVAPAEYFVLLGPNGSGKTTFLRCLAGLERPTAGRVILAGNDLTDVPPHRRGVGLMFQDPALFVHRTVFENVAYAPLVQHRPRPEVDEVVGRLLALLHLEGFEDRRPESLSGGERQRVALARTLAARPRLVLLDEPFASIDPELKADLRSEFRRALTALGTAAIHVTHDREEGLFLGDRVGLLFDGTLTSVGPPRSVYDAPREERAARFLGYNIVRTGPGVAAVHPRDVELVEPSGGDVEASVVAGGTVGRETLLVLRTDAGERVEARLAPNVAVPPRSGRVGLRWARAVPLDGN